MKKLIVLLTLFFIGSVTGFGQVDEMERLRKQEEAFKKKQKKSERTFKQDQEKELQKLYEEYLEYEKKREKEILKFLGKNIDEDLREKAEKMESLVPRDITYLDKDNPKQLAEKLAIKAEMLAKEKAKESEKPAHKSQSKSEKRVEADVDKTEVAEKSQIPKEDDHKLVKSDKTEKAEKEIPDVIKKEIEANRPVFIPLKEGSYRVSSHFNKDRMHPTLKKRRPHNGIDLAAPTGTPIYASADGLIEIAQFSKSAGNWIMLNHQNGYKTHYFHLNKLAVKSGKKVKRGDLIGYVGTTGYSSGPHLHYEVRKKNIPTDPKNYFIAHL